jgi:hypothetical protein
MKKRFSKTVVKTPTIQNLTRWAMKWTNATWFTNPPALGSSIAILRHKLPARIVTVKDFITKHLERVKIQKKIADLQSPNSALYGVQAVAVPILAGYDPSSKEFVTVMEYGTGMKPFPRSPGHIEYAALERSLCKVWSFGFQLATLDTTLVSMSASFDVIIYDCSQLVQPTKWLARIFSHAVPGDANGRFESRYAPGGDATIMAAMYEKASVHMKPDEWDALVDDARNRLWQEKNVE